MNNHHINNSYLKDDIVSFDGKVYIAKQDISSGVSITNTTFWKELVHEAPTAG